MAGEQGGDPFIAQSVTAGRDAWVAGRDMHIYQGPAVEVPSGDRDTLTALVRAATVWVGTGDGGGTGFFIAPGVVVTCARVIVPDDDGPLPAVVRGRIATAGRDVVLETVPDWLFRGEGGGEGVAFLQARDCDDVRPVLTLPGVAPGDPMWAFGHPSGEHGDGYSASVTYEELSRASGSGTVPRGRISGPGLRPGVVGGPVLNFRTGAVCGMACWPTGQDSLHLLPVADLLGRGPLAVSPPDLPAGLAHWLDLLPDELIRSGGWRYPGPRLRAYLEAAARKAQEHPYMRVLGGRRPPPLAAVYVRQQALAVGQRQRRDRAREVVAADDAEGWVPSEAVFERDENCFIIAGPGGGKSSLLRMGLLHAATAWVQGRPGTTAPVHVTAADLAGNRPLPEAIAAVVRADLKMPGFGKAELARMLGAEPLGGCKWLVLVDGLDELTGSDERRKIIDLLTESVRGLSPCPYRFIVATRSLPDGEVPHGDGWAEHAYELQPLDASQVQVLAEQWFTTFDVPDPGLAATRFIAEVARAGLADLAQVPLMATILCQLRAVNPGRDLPDGRAGAYRDFVDLLAGHSQSAGAGGLSAQINATLKQYGAVAQAAGAKLQERSTELVGRLALARIAGEDASQPAVDRLLSWTAADRPANVLVQDWRSVLAELLRHSGVLTERGSDMVFLHQTIAEYLAARYVTTDPQRSAWAWRNMFVLPWGWALFPGSWSYRRFLVAAWASDPRVRPKLPPVLLHLAKVARHEGQLFIAALARDGIELDSELVEAVSAMLAKGAARHATWDRVVPNWLRPPAVPVNSLITPSINREYSRYRSAERRAEAISALMLLGKDYVGSAMFEKFLADPLVTIEGLWRSTADDSLLPLPAAQKTEILSTIVNRSMPVRNSRDWVCVHWQEEAFKRRREAGERLREIGEGLGGDFLDESAREEITGGLRFVEDYVPAVAGVTVLLVAAALLAALKSPHDWFAIAGSLSSLSLLSLWPRLKAGARNVLMLLFVPAFAFYVTGAVSGRNSWLIGSWVSGIVILYLFSFIAIGSLVWDTADPGLDVTAGPAEPDAEDPAEVPPPDSHDDRAVGNQSGITRAPGPAMSISAPGPPDPPANPEAPPQDVDAEDETGTPPRQNWTSLAIGKISPDDTMPVDSVRGELDPAVLWMPATGPRRALDRIGTTAAIAVLVLLVACIIAYNIQPDGANFFSREGRTQVHSLQRDVRVIRNLFEKI